MNDSKISNSKNINNFAKNEEICLCLVSDFFYPDIGGIETHIYEIAKQFLVLGIKKIIVITRNRDENRFCGVKFIHRGQIKVYYLKRCDFSIPASLPTFWWTAPELFKILKNEGITHVHCHQTTSTLGFEAGTIAMLLGLRLYMTEHSLFSLGVVGALHLSATISTVLHYCDKIIAVSEVQAKNIEARVGKLNNIVVIPNGIDPSLFYRPKNEPENYPTIVSVTRFEKRRGGNFLPFIIERVLASNKNARFIIAGGGSQLEETKRKIENSEYGDRVEILGEIKHRSIPSILRRGHIFLNCSLTDSFCVSIVEAASCGLYVVSTDVGGIPDTLPRDMITLVRPSAEEITNALLNAIERKHDLRDKSEMLKEKLSWNSISQKIINIYKEPTEKKNPFRVCLTHSGPIASVVSFLYLTSIYILLVILNCLL